MPTQSRLILKPPNCATQGWTALHKAALLKGQHPPDAGMRLLELGADPTIRTKVRRPCAEP